VSATTLRQQLGEEVKTFQGVNKFSARLLIQFSQFTSFIKMFKLECFHISTVAGNVIIIKASSLLSSAYLAKGKDAKNGNFRLIQQNFIAVCFTLK
jgi:hypothetical protein